MIRYYTHWLWTFLIIIMVGTVMFFINEKFQESEIDKRRLKLEHIHGRAISQFTKSIDKFAAIITGMRSYMNLSKNLPNANEFQLFIQNQLNDVNYKDSIVVSYLDSTHTFIYSFTRNKMDPVGLVGKSVNELRDQSEIDRLNNLMKNDKIRLFNPINLLEGWIGIPINFRVHREGKTIGYVAPILNFKSIIQSMYDYEIKNEFVFHFQTQRGEDFDREMIYNGTKVHHNRKDKEYYKNFNVKSANFLYWYVDYYGMQFKIGTAYKKPYQPDIFYTLILYGSFFIFTIFLLLLRWQIEKYRNLNILIKEKNVQLENKQGLILKLNKEHYKLNTELSELNDTKDKFLAIIGHDIKGPLNSVTGLLQLMELTKALDPGIVPLITNCKEATKNTVNLLNNLLNWARSQSGEIEFNPEKININQLITENINTLTQQAAEKKINLLSQLSEDIELSIDKNMISTIIRNLVSNAIKFTKINGAIKINTEITNNSFKITVIDNGIGMREEDIDKLFNLDRHLSTKGTTGEIGTGLGLLLCSEFVKKHRGKIEVKSGINKGSTFIVILPF